MSRILQTGAEWQVINELNDISGNGFITTSTTQKIGGGAASYRMQYNTSGFVQNYGYVPIPGNPTDVYYKADVYVDALTATTDTSSARTFVYPIRFYSSNYVASVGLYNDAGTLHCFVQYGTSSTLTHDVELTGVGLDEWLRVEAHFDSTPADGSEVFQVKINGELIVDDQNLTLSGKTMAYAFYHVTNNTSGTTTADVYMDNISINNSSGTVNNSWVGEEYIVILKPTGAGDSNPTQGSYSSVNEIPATKSQAGGYDSYIQMTGSGTAGQFTITDPTTLIPETDRVKAVSVVHWSIYASANPSYQSLIKSASGGSESNSATGQLNGSDFYINSQNITQYARNNISEVDPTTGSRWKVVGTNSLSNAQIGVRITTSGTISTAALGAMVAFSPYTAPTTSGMLIMFW